MKFPRTKATPAPFGPERAEEIWAQRGLEHEVSHAMTDGEDEYVHAVWSTMPGHTCWADAFHRIRLGKVPPAADVNVTIKGAP